MADITVTFGDGQKHLYKGVPDNISPDEVIQRASKDFAGMEIAAVDRKAGKPDDPLTALAKIGVRTGASAVAGFGKMAALAPKAAGMALPVGDNAARDLNELGDSVENYWTEFGKKHGLENRFGRAVTETVGGGVAGGLPATGRNVATLAGAGAGSELAADAFGDNPISRVAGAMLGGSVPAIVNAHKPNAERLLKQATEQIPEPAWRRAKAAESTLNEAGIPHLKSQLLGEGSTLPDLVAVASQHPSVRPRLVTSVEKAPERSRQAFERWGQQNLPIGVDETRSVFGDVQGAAQQRINDLRTSANAKYKAAMPPGVQTDTYTPAQVRQLAETLRQQAQDPAKFGPLTAGGQFMTRLADDVEGIVKSSSILGPNGLPLERNVPKGFVNNLLKDLNTRAEKEGYKGLSMDEVKAAVKAATPEFEAAREAKTAAMTGVVNPAQRGLLGQLAGMGGGVRPDKTTASARAIDIVFPKDQRQPDAIVELGKQFGGERVGEILREHLARSMEQSVKLTAEAGKMQQPFNFVQAVAGTNAQRQNVEAALMVTSEAMGANPAAVRNGFYKLMRAMETTKDLKLPASVDRATLQQQAGLNVPGLLVAPQSRLGRVLWERATEKTFKQIADVVMSPEGLKELERIAKTPGHSAANAYARSLISATVSPSEPPESAP